MDRIFWKSIRKESITDLVADIVMAALWPSPQSPSGYIEQPSNEKSRVPNDQEILADHFLRTEFENIS